MSKTAVIFLAAMTGILFSFSAQAQGFISIYGKRAEVGGLFSPKHSGLTVVIPYNEDTAGEIRLVADLEGIVTARENVPGIRFSYLQDNILKHWDASENLDVRLVFSPGISLGVLSDRHTKMGLLAAMTGEVGFDFAFRESPIVIAARFGADIGCHMTEFSNSGCKMNFYRNGLYRTFYPELSVRYRF